MNAYGYIRVSTFDQSENGHSLDAQKARIEAYCKVKSLNLAGIFVDSGVSGGKPICDRPEGKSLCATIGKGDHIIATKLDRLFRNTLDCLDTVERKWIPNKVTLHLLDLDIDTSKATGMLLLQIVAAVAQMERAQVVERTKAVAQHLKATGKVAGQVPFGYHRDGNELVVDENEQVTITAMRKLRGEGKSYGFITTYLNTNNLPTKSGGHWHRYTVQKVLGEA